MTGDARRRRGNANPHGSPLIETSKSPNTHLQTSSLSPSPPQQLQLAQLPRPSHRDASDANRGPKARKIQWKSSHWHDKCSSASWNTEALWNSYPYIPSWLYKSVLFWDCHHCEWDESSRVIQHPPHSVPVLSCDGWANFRSAQKTKYVISISCCLTFYFLFFLITNPKNWTCYRENLADIVFCFLSHHFREMKEMEACCWRGRAQRDCMSVEILLVSCTSLNIDLMSWRASLRIPHNIRPQRGRRSHCSVRSRWSPQLDQACAIFIPASLVIFFLSHLQSRALWLSPHACRWTCGSVKAAGFVMLKF